MTLERYLRGNPSETSHFLTHRFSERLRQLGYPVSVPTLFRVKRKQRNASLPLALAIEMATDGVVTAEELPLTARNRKALNTLRREAR